MLISRNWQILKEHTDRWLAMTLGCGATALMAAAAVTRFPCRRLMRLEGERVACDTACWELSWRHGDPPPAAPCFGGCSAGDCH